MLNLKGYNGFGITETQSKESLALIQVCTLQDIKFYKFKKHEKCPEDLIPCGSVEWCTLSLGREVKPDYFPEWMKDHIYRKIWYEDKWPLGTKVFIKPSDRHKRFIGFITTGTYAKKKRPPYVCSEIVDFINEWRYYITNGKVVACEWYWGKNENAPKFDLYISGIKILKGWSGTLDMGLIRRSHKQDMFQWGDFALIEAHPPFACGWYGKDTETYLQWLIDGWIYMKEKYK
jgi:hypothetical protein